MRPGQSRLVERLWPVAAAAMAGALAGCQASDYRQQADQVVDRIIADAQSEAAGRTEPFTVERPADTLRRRLFVFQSLPFSSEASLGSDVLSPVPFWPETDYPRREDRAGAAVEAPGSQRPVTLTLLQSLQVAARNSRQYQSRKEDVFIAALELDLERDAFRLTYAGLIENLFDSDSRTEPTVINMANSTEQGFTWRLKNGATLASRIIFDLSNLLRQDRVSSYGVFADASITVPLLSGSGEHIVAEPLTQAERNVVYALQQFERFKRTFAVEVASSYFNVLQQQDRVDNDRANYDNLRKSVERLAELAKAGRRSRIEVDQARQDELRGRDRWIASRRAYGRGLDDFKVTLGLPTDARLELDRRALQRLSAGGQAYLADLTTRPVGATTMPAKETYTLLEPGRRGVGPLELAEDHAISLALQHRMDLRVAEGRVIDAQRAVVVAADALRTGATFAATWTGGERRGIGQAGSPNGHLRFEASQYQLALDVDLPWEKTAERNAYRISLIDLERAVRDVQDTEDRIKADVREALRKLLQARESYRIQSEAVKLAIRRVESTNLFLEAGRAEARDLLEAQESLVTAQNNLTAALVDYRVAELEIQRDMGVLDVDSKGLWREYDPNKPR